MRRTFWERTFWAKHFGGEHFGREHFGENILGENIFGTTFWQNILASDWSSSYRAPSRFSKTTLVMCYHIGPKCLIGINNAQTSRNKDNLNTKMNFRFYYPFRTNLYIDHSTSYGEYRSKNVLLRNLT